MRVAVVVDRQLGEGLVPLAARMPVWICDTPTNRPWFERARSDGEVTSFSARDADTPEAMALGVLPTVDLHHGEWSQDEPWSELEIVGTGASALLRTTLEDYGVVRFERTPGGFVGLRDPAGRRHST